ncbi:helix-turn-helix domain-containing protein [Halomicroarcula limicola]|uniref:Helix-turn-helix domain-containing protein n=1 Tax=Haloarcula limicola TaxID=1429915 RepID=A0A8J8C206_9EURY|nr:helix-turn-helix domain-containing protein [Halomicroarcula limicola]MBV0923021.1 helix-turn-helix domain-containing protein [Halomicroarcula limicola]
MIDIAMDMEQYDCPFIDTTADHGVAFAAVHWDFDTAKRELETRMVVEADDREVLDHGLSTLRDHPNMNDVSLLRRQDAAAHIRTVMVETTAMETIRDNGGYITGPFHIEAGSEVWHVGFDRGRDADDTLSELDRDNEFDVIERSPASLPQLQDVARNAGAAMTLIEGCRDLSETERETLEEAVSSGYFQSPRDATLGTLAEEFGVSKPAVSKNLRRGERKMIERVVDALEDIDS